LQSSPHNVFPLPGPRRSLHDLPVALELLRLAVLELNKLLRSIERVGREPHWSALEWRAACTPLMLRLPTSRQSLASLADIRLDQWPDVSWAVRLHAARDEVEGRLTYVSTSMSALTDGMAITADAVLSFSVDCTSLAKAVDELSGLIVSQYPEAVGAV
jgi:hypothetical protein